MCSIFRLILAFSILNLSVNVYANQPIARFKNNTVGILAESDAGVFISTENVTILGDLEVKATNQTTNITQQVDSLIGLQSNLELRVNTFAQHAKMGVVCDPEGTKYRARNFENDEFGECICKEGYGGILCEPVFSYVYTFEISVMEYGQHMEITKIELDNKTPNFDDVNIIFQANNNAGIIGGCNITVMLDDIDMSYCQWRRPPGSDRSVGARIFEVVSDAEVSKISISYWRPRYAPGWRILKNGEEILMETINHGNDAWPAPVTYEYLT
jgi:hypothetical protein